MNQLTERQSAILSFIAEAIDRDGFPPCIREIGERFGITTPHGVVGHLNALEKKGYIVRRGKVARGIALVNRTCPECERLRAKVKELEGMRHDVR